VNKRVVAASSVTAPAFRMSAALIEEIKKVMFEVLGS
jgi:hypothetical protein